MSKARKKITKYRQRENERNTRLYDNDIITSYFDENEMEKYRVKRTFLYTAPRVYFESQSQAPNLTVAFGVLICFTGCAQFYSWEMLQLAFRPFLCTNNALEHKGPSMLCVKEREREEKIW